MKRVTRMLQTDKLLPRMSPRSRMTFSPCYSAVAVSLGVPRTIPRNESSSSYPRLINFPVIVILSPSSPLNHLCSTNHYNSLRFPSLKNCYYSSSSSTSSELPAMEKEKYSKVSIKDQQREGFAKSSCDYDPSNPPFHEILPHLLNIYGSRGTAKDFEIYAPDATFEDPLMRAQGLKQIKSAFYSIPKVFSESRIVEYSIKENTISPGNKEILMDNKQYYKFMGRDIHMISLIKLQLKDGKIVRHEDLWDKKPLKNRETVQFPLIGRILELTRRGSMLATHAMMGFGKDPTASM
ncbi:OLC1v1026420C1 [Oldenlandia corymbosa var. corymbosa]|uniref:OLC1v1026420C1 n=1 Tax=Oldenlandia corymbosa var. corymbosa TaxID=529605 RepID=A0AAV1C7B3_OLDCO|nr:OLC1v1026420C1 [Oldenlandia corymbosa var. corymbosa]